jgi:hypothetical protein
MSMSNEHPSPCPFCGGVVLAREGFHMTCIRCGADGPDGDWADEVAASAAWNRRAEHVAGPAWQPIATAPKDGRDLLLWEAGSFVPFVGAWRDGRRPGWHCDTEHYDTDGNACVVSKLWQEGITHWMPIPPAPSA